MKDIKKEEDLSVLSGKIREVIENEQITSVFQPIVSLRDGSVLGYEALSRGPAQTELENPEKLFAVAEHCRTVWDLELLCRRKALSAMQNSKVNTTMFLNVHPNVIEDPKFQQGFTKEYLREYGIDPEQIIFEITEKSAIANMSDFKDTIQNYKEQDYKIAIDDAGAGYSGLNLISDVRPHFLKLDMNLIRGIDKDTVRKALVSSMYEFSKTTGTYLIAEGIETFEELQTLIHIGVHYGQGFYIKRPDALIAPLHNEVISTIKEINEKKNHLFGYNLQEIYIGNLCGHAIAVNEDIMISEAYSMMSKAAGSQGFCVTRDGLVQGVVTRNMLNSEVAGVYGYSLYSRKPITAIMDRDFLSMDFKTPVNIAGKLAMSRSDSKVYDFITVTQDGKYCGVVTIKDLLNKTIEIEVSNAMQLNPLTMLPGNVAIERALIGVLRSPDKRCVLYFDIDNFKPYNDVYGFENGDRVIKKLADIITKTITAPDFTGHLGGDDFVAVVPLKDAESISSCILKEFDSEVNGFYSEEDKINGYIIAKNRQGFKEQYPLISLSIAGISAWAKRFANVYELSAESSRIKKECKVIVGSTFLIA